MTGANERSASGSPPLSMFGWRSVGDFLLHCLFVGGFVVTIGFFSLVDVYDKHFFQSSYAAIYNAFRVVFAAYFFWLVYVVGRQALSFVAKDPLAGLRLHERLALGFFVGAAVLTVVMLVLGYLSLYWRVVAWAIAVPIIAVSYRQFAVTVHEAESSIAQHFREVRNRQDLVDRDDRRGGFRRCRTPAREGALPAGRARLLPALLAFLCGGDRQSRHLAEPVLVPVLPVEGHGRDVPGHVAHGCPRLRWSRIALSSPRHWRCTPWYGTLSHTLWPWLAVVLYLALNVHTLGTGAYSATAAGATFKSRTS